MLYDKSKVPIKGVKQMYEDAVQFLTNRYSGLTGSEKQLADYLIRNMNNILQMSVKELAEHSQVSVATVVRLAQHLGFDGYSSFRLHLAKIHSVQEDYVLDIQKKDTDIQKQIHKVLNANIDSIRLTIECLDLSLVEQAARRLCEAERVLFFGTGTSHIVCTDAAFKFQRINKISYSAEDLHTAAVYLSHFKENDVVVAISHSGRTNDTVKCLQLAQKKAIQTIAITTFQDSPIYEYAGLVLNTMTRESPMHKVAITSRTSQFAIIDAMFMAALMTDYDKSIDAVMKTSSLLEDL